MTHPSVRRARRARRANRRTLRSESCCRTAANQLTSSGRRRPRSLATAARASGVAKDTEAGVADGLRGVVKRLGLTPVATAHVKRTTAGSRAPTAPTRPAAGRSRRSAR